ncbi:E3 ubiquitin-protein ligase MYCBP2 isoform X3 [Pieris napi]|uniref:E3 ubiquitin-protein ligase MYCBP2 isoform X3 n=1 Tax=Pieris napi TaxID=78633 RepID=UPI001FB88D52|nr:E3 ubiquitin-protein ligase MYCBP2 isoform X3 [Pieris napi]
MAQKNQMAEIRCMEPENYRKYFRSLCWSGNRKLDRRIGRRGIRKERSRRSKGPNAFAICFAPALLGNPSQFAVYATVRKSILSRWRHLQGSVADLSDESDNDDQNQLANVKLPKITGIGLRTVFSLIDQARFKDASLCESALRALLDVLQAHAPEDLSHENSEIISNLHDILVEITSGIGASGRPEIPTALTSISSSCLIALSVAKGEAELILNTVKCLIMVSPSLSDQYIQVPINLTMLQRSVQSIILGSPSRNLWLDYGVPHQCLVNSFPVDLPAQLITGSQELVIRSLVSDGCFLYVFTSRGLLKIGSGYGNSIRQHVYLYKPDFFASDRHGWLGLCKDKLYVRIGRKKTDIYEIDKDTFEVKGVLHLEPGTPVAIEPKSAVFSDANQLGLVLLTNFDNLTIKFYDLDSTCNSRIEGNSRIVESVRELNVHLLRRTSLILGRAPYEDGISRRITDLDAPVAIQLDDNEDDPLMAISAGQDFGLLTTASGKVYYTGKATSLGYKVSSSYIGRWTLMKETVFVRNDHPKVRKTRVIQVAVGHEGVHAILVLDNGTALFTGIARRGEDGDGNKRRSPKPSRPKKIAKAENFYIVYAACNYGSTALVTRQGVVLMFGKDTQHCDSAGIVTGLRHERIVQVALGKAHAVALTNLGQVYSFGINNKGQCGREFGYTKEKPYPQRKSSSREEPNICSEQHTWLTDYCRICVNCRECTGFAGNCSCAALPNRIPGEKCGCGEGESGCSTCGICRRCADVADMTRERVPDSEDDISVYDIPSTSEQVVEEEIKYIQYEAHCSKDEGEKDAGFKGSSLTPARIPLPGGHKIEAIACGLHHTVLLTHMGDVLTFGSNQYGALGAGDISAHHRIIRVRVPRASAIAAGSNHTAVLTRDGELYTFGNYQKGALGRPRIDEPRTDRCPIWYATPGKVPRLGPKYNCKAVSVSASGDQTFVQVSQAVLKTDTVFSATITANKNTIIILPNRPEHTFKCVTICKSDGSCYPWSGPEQVDFVNTLACLDPLYDVLWCYQPQMRVMKSYNIKAFDAHKLQRCCKNDPEGFINDMDFEYPHYGIMRRLEEFKNLDNFEWISNSDDRPADGVAIANISILNQDLALPCVKNCSVTRIHAALHLLGCLDSLLYAHDNRLSQVECKRDSLSIPISPLREDYLTVNRFESHGGGWGYSGHSIEAIRFMSDTDILLGGYGLFGGRGEYTAKIKLIDIGTEGGDQEGDGDVLAETGEIPYECAPRDKYPILFESPIVLAAQRWYVAWTCINGPSSDCGSTGQAIVINDDVGFHFKTSKKSNNGTDVNAGQIPCLLYNVINHEHVPKRRKDPGEPVIILSRNISRKVTVACFKSLITLLQWSWSTFKELLLDTNGQIPINYQKLTIMKHQKRLVYVIRACLRLVKTYINEIYPQNNRKRNSQEYMAYVETIADIRNLIQAMMADQTPTCAMLPRKPGRNKSQRVCYVQFALEMTNAILKEAHDTVTVCFHAFFPTPILKWHHLCSLLYNVSDGIVPASQIRELTSTCAAMCGFRSIRDVLQYIVPVTQSCIMLNEMRKESRVVKEVPSKSATVPRSAHSQHSPKPPPIPPRANREARPQNPAWKSNHTDWHLLDIIPKLLDMVMLPIKDQMMTRQCGQSHDHGEIQQNDKLADFCCKFIVRIIAELAFSSKNIKEDSDTAAIKHLITPSRFIRVNPTRSWNTSSGSPDAICFNIDRPGIVLVGACVYGGPGTFEYTLELLHDVRLRTVGEEARSSHCWISVEVVHGSFSAADCQHDMVQIKFDRPVPLKEDLRYALRFCNNGGRTANGDSGLSSVKGPDGTTFTFSSCSLSFNGTTLVRGQVPCLIYYGTTKPSNSSENPDTLMAALRAITLKVASMVIERAAELFCTLRNELTTEDLRRNAVVLQQSSVINTLIPYVLAYLEGLDDSKSVIHLLEIIHKLLPHVSAMNLLVPSVEEISTTTTTHYYTWIESDHPYKQATVSNMRVLFPSQVSWIVLEMDPRSITAQPEDNLTIYAVAGSPRHRCHCSSEYRVPDPPFRKVYQRIVQLTSDSGEVEELDEGCLDAPCMQYSCTYVSVTPKLSNMSADWPHKGLLIPGNEVIFSLETASDYLNEYKNDDEPDESRFGFRCLCAGYEDAPFTSQRQGLVSLEMELVYTGAACASRLLAPDIDISPLSYLTVVELQMLAGTGNSPGGEADGADESEAMFLYRGLDLPSPPTVHNVLDGQALLRCVSTERQFLSDFVAGAESTAGGRLARWLAPTPRVEPSNCDLKAPVTVVHPSTRVNLPVVVRDQYGDIVTSSAVKIEVIVQNMAMSLRMRRPTEAEQEGGIPNVRYSPTIRETMRFQTITMMKAYQDYSWEELRFASGLWGEEKLKGIGILNVPTEKITVRAQTDGSYSALWIPRAPGKYLFRCTLDDQPSPQEVIIEVPENENVDSEELCPTARAPTKLKKFMAQCSAGLRVRASPSLQAEELGRVPSGAYVTLIEEVTNKDGTWVRLNNDSVQAYVEGNVDVAWCLQYHRQLDRALLGPVEDGPTTPTEEGLSSWSRLDAPSAIPTRPNKSDAADDDITTEERPFPFSIGCDLGDEDEKSHVPEPSKFERRMRNEAVARMQQQAAKIVQLPELPIDQYRRNNGNGDGDDEDLGQAIRPVINEVNVANIIADVNDANIINAVDAVAAVLDESAKVVNDASRDDFVHKPPAMDPADNAQEIAIGSDDNEANALKPCPKDVEVDENIEAVQTANDKPDAKSLNDENNDKIEEEKKLTQAATQTSPETSVQGQSSDQPTPSTSKGEKRVVVRERVGSISSFKQSSPPPLPARTKLAPIKKQAQSPAQGECLRAIFAALLWHEGTVHDAIACAAFLKFHPQLPKAGATVVTRAVAQDSLLPKHQRHSVEVSNAGQYLRINPSTLETLTRSGTEATASRARRSDINITIREEDSHSTICEAGPSTASTSTSVVNVLPPALRALVALWDSLCDADQLNAATDKLKKEETNDNDEIGPLGGALRKKNWKQAPSMKLPSMIRCELCGGANVSPPLASHMRNTHPGCRAPTNRGYDRAGTYKHADPIPSTADSPASACGQLAQAAYQLWYLYCEKCREKALKASSVKPKKTVMISDTPLRPEPEIDHNIMKDNAIFLLDLTPLNTSEAPNASPWQDVSCRSPPTPPGSLWQPAPPFQCLPALGVAPKTSAADAARYHSLGRPMPVTNVNNPFVPNEMTSSQYPRVHRSVSMGQAGGRDLASAARPPLTKFEPDSHEALSGAGSSLLSQPSAALQKLVGCDWTSEGGGVSAFTTPRVESDILMRNPVLTFIVAKRDLQTHKQKLDAIVRINTVRQYAFEALNWFLRSTTQPTCVHDVMWWFCNALDTYARIVQPPDADEENKENVLNNDASRGIIPSAATSALCPGGRAARGARAAFHAFLGSISALAPSLPPATAANLQAVRCWELHYSQHDRAFLHRSQVFSVISKILSHTEDGVYEDGILGALHESYQSFINKQQNYLWSCPEVTGWCTITVSSREGMAGALTDNTTETFWESGDEDKNRTRWIQIAYNGGSAEDRPHIVCVHIDNTRDTATKTQLITFWYSGGPSELLQMMDVDVDTKNAHWVCYILPKSSSISVRVRCELRGPDPAVRVRQVRVLSGPQPHGTLSLQNHPLHSLTEKDTLRVFRLLTSQVFGKLLEWEQTGDSEGVVAGESTGDDSDLREHVVGILFAGHKLTTLQKQVMSHIVCAIGCEASRVRDDWETALLCAEAVDRSDEDAQPRLAHQQDNYCFEMLSLLLALSGSVAGRSHLAQRTELLADLLALLHTGSDRVQRQVISLLRRMITEIPPQKMLAALNYGSDLGARYETMVTLLDHLVCYVGKAVTVQVKVKGASGANSNTVTMGGSVTPAPPATWFMRGETTRNHAQIVARLLVDMAEDKISPAWGTATRMALAEYIRAIANVDEGERRPQTCIAQPTVWLALAALCVCEQEHIELINNSGRDSRNRDSIADSRQFCANHDDGITCAVIECRTCGTLCAECDRFLHLNRTARTHQRQICKEEESAIRVDIHEGCGRAKLFWLLLLVDRRTLKGLAEFRGMSCETGEEPPDATGLAGVCRFCGTRGNSGLLAIGNVCADQQCQEHGREACARILTCGHLCGGVRGERSCLPCLFGCAGAGSLRQDADDMCMICFTDPLQAAPAIQLTCGHVFHLHCCRKVLLNKWNGPRITFSFSKCPICKEDISHWTLEEQLAPIKKLREEVRRKALMRLEYEGLSAGTSKGKNVGDTAGYAMDRYAYYVCHKCGKAYFGGLARCEAESNASWDPKELVCGACSDVAGARTCPKHGSDFLEYKCRYCCSVAVFFCFGTSHFCNACHDDFQRVTNIPRHMLPQCPAGPKCEQLPGTTEECPLHVLHPPTGEEFALGCGVCRNAHAF